ncbi:splicing factor 45 [Stomoxys calcitrans]|uniref:splicing factor 45 n=1 Tax=Stomoxys calcitrans TaxID=35570 RepID=UPI0027E39BAE|nr:splicing factor 45 [Stomoxys calcitrans]
MDLYDDIDTKPKASQIDGWSSGIKMLQTQLAIKKAGLPKPRETSKKPLMTPVVNLKAKKLQSPEEIILSKHTSESKPIIQAQPLVPSLENIKTDDWDFVDEYDPSWPNEYDKLKEKKNSLKDKGREERDRGERPNRGDRDRERKRNRRNSRNRESPPVKFSGFGQRIADEDRYSPPSMAASGSGKGGVTIAPPPSLQEISIENDGDPSSNVTIPYSATSVAAKIMAKYGFKDGQGLGKQEQGMSMALQVEKTSKRGGRIIHERDVFLPPPQPPAAGNSPAASSPIANMAPPAQTSTESGSNPSITEIMKAPSKVVLLRNMVGPGDVDDELEPEVKDECNTKYGDVNKVLIHESFGTTPEDAVKIFVEFKRMESAIKAVVDLNGRFFGGRQVRAGFYDFDKFRNLELS